MGIIYRLRVCYTRENGAFGLPKLTSLTKILLTSQLTHLFNRNIVIGRLFYSRIDRNLNAQGEDVPSTLGRVLLSKWWCLCTLGGIIYRLNVCFTRKCLAFGLLMLTPLTISMWPNGQMDQMPFDTQQVSTSSPIGTQLPTPKGAQPPIFWPMSIVAKRSPISATAELLFLFPPQIFRGSWADFCEKLHTTRRVMKYFIFYGCSYVVPKN